MAQNKVYKFRDIVELQSFLNGAIFGADVIPKNGNVPGGGGNPNNLGIGIRGLVGKTLIFTSPSAQTVTFTASTQSGNPDTGTLMPADIKSQIETALATVKVSFQGGRIVITEATPTSGVAVSAVGTANGLLGFDSAQATTGKLFQPPPSTTAPCWTWAGVTNDNAHIIYTWE